MIIDKTHEAVPRKPIATSSSPRPSTAISPSLDPRKQSPPADLYVNDRLTIHGVDGVLDPNSVSKCMFPDQTFLIKSGGVDPFPSQSQSPLDHAVKALSKRGVLAVSHTIDELKHSSAKGPISKERERDKKGMARRESREGERDREGRWGDMGWWKAQEKCLGGTIIDLNR
ncbi:hypothetical protein CsSME_00031348 [Camellia sinensis var. sinensis]